MAEIIDPSSYQDFTLQTLMTPDGITRINSILRQLSQTVTGDTETVRVFTGVGTPEASVAAGVGSIYMRTDGGADTAVYKKETGTGDTGWVAVKSPASLPLSTANGGLGADASAWTAGEFLYLSATGVIGHEPLPTPSFSSVAGSYTAGNYLVKEDNNIYTTTSSSYIKVSEIYIPRGGTLRIKFYLRDPNGTGGFGRIYRNGSAVGTQQTDTSSDGVYFSEDISGWSAGDLVQLYIHDGNGGNTCFGGALSLLEGTPAGEKINAVTYPPERTYLGNQTPVAVLNGLGNIGDFFKRNDGNTAFYYKSAATTWTAK